MNEKSLRTSVRRLFCQDFVRIQSGFSQESQAAAGRDPRACVVVFSPTPERSALMRRAFIFCRNPSLHDRPFHRAPRRRHADRGEDPRTPLRRAAGGVSRRAVHSTRGAARLSGELRGTARPASLPHPQAEVRRHGHPDGGAYRPVHALRGSGEGERSGAGRSLSRDVRDAHADQEQASAAFREDGEGTEPEDPRAELMRPS